MLSSIPFFFLLATARTRAADIVDTGYAQYLGNRTFPNAVAYLGIPYAEPPLGERRFRAPLPLNKTRITQEANGNVVDATKYPNFCIQNNGGAGSEDCLKVNIYAPAGARKGDNLPILFYIHGGGYVFGNPRNWPFDHWIRQSPNVVIVSVYYRLDSLGFLSIPEFNDPALGDSNAGFLDQIEALRWVRDNIEAFGGDPKQVTINGQSAGGGSVQHHLLAVEDEGLFSGAIAQSVERAVTPSPEQVKPLFDFYAEAAGCDATTVEGKLACLREVDVTVLARTQDSIGGNFNRSYKSFMPVLDGKVIVGHPTTLIREGRFKHVPIIVGSVTNETQSNSANLAATLHSSFPALTDDDAQDILAVYPQSDFSSSLERASTLTSEETFVCAREIFGAAWETSPISWTYRYNQPNPTQPASLGTAHAAENWMMFLGTNTGANGSTTFTPMTPTENAFAEELIAYWLSFVRSGDPNTFKLSRSPLWPRYHAVGGQRVVLQEDPGKSTTRSGIFVEDEPENQVRRCGVVASKSEGEQN